MWNVKNIALKGEELGKQLVIKYIDFAVISETKKKNKITKKINNY